MSADIRERLRRLGVHKGVAHLKPSPAKILEVERAKLEAVESSKLKVESEYVTDTLPLSTFDFPLSTIDTPFGDATFSRATYAIDHTHGDRPIRQALQHPHELLGRLVGRAVPAFDLSDALFIDTETTGLAGGAGTLAFMVGIGYFAMADDRPPTTAFGRRSSVVGGQSSFVVDQFFLRDPAEEMAMLHQIDALLASRRHIVTFNGRSFDVPLLETRFTLSRMPPSFDEKLHLDLLMPARRAWRNMIGACNLGALEYHLLGVRRDQHDIAGFLIPELYREWLAHNTGELNQDMQRVMYHNLHDILSMVTLSARLCEAFAQPSHPSEYLAIGKEHEQRSAWDQAEQVYRSANAQLPKPDMNISRRLAYTLKRQGKLDEAIPHWQALSDNNDVEAQIELSKHYEWRNVNYELALRFAQRALQHTQNPIEQQALTHRIERLENKQRRALQLASKPATSH